MKKNHSNFDDGLFGKLALNSKKL